MAEKDTRFQITTRNNEIITLDKATVIKYLTDNQNITDSEFTVIFQLCKTYGLNPFLKEAYIVKYANSPATIVMDYKVLQQAAEENPEYEGMEHGVIVANKQGEIIERKADYKLPGETLVAGWCVVHRKNRKVPTRVDANFDEFKATKKDGTLNANWAGKPCFMIVKVAKAQALREAFPNLFGSNVYISEELENTNLNPVEEEKERKTTVNNKIVDVDDEGVVVDPNEPIESGANND